MIKDENNCDHENTEWCEDGLYCNDCGTIVGQTCRECLGDGIVEKILIDIGHSPVSCPRCSGTGQLGAPNW